MCPDNFSKYGIDVAGLTVNLPNMLAQKVKAVKGLTSGIEGLFKKNKVEYFKAHATITGKNDIQLTPIDGSAKTTINTTNIVIATGSVPATLPGIEGKKITCEVHTFCKLVMNDWYG